MVRPAAAALTATAAVLGGAAIAASLSLTRGARADDPPPLAPEESAAALRLPEGFEARLVAAEPVLANPMTMALDEEGRIYVSLAHSYRYGPEGSPVSPPSNPVVRLELGPDGRLARHSVVAAGFANPVMGIAVRGGRIWLTNADRLLVAVLDAEGRAIEPRAIVRDAESPWNPFGMYRVRFGPDGLLYLTVGDHPAKLTGPTNTAAVRGSTGAVFRLEPDGSSIEVLLQGMRAPFSLDIGPFGDLWVLSNGEGNPNRLIHAERGADYHFQTRPADWAWLAGRHPLAPPVWENPPGAHTAVVACHGLELPEDYEGDLLVSNWGAHGFPSANHAVLRLRLDATGEVASSEPFLSSADPRFRPTQLLPAPGGGIYVLDWHGRDDENDLTGRLYKIDYKRSHSGPRRDAAALEAARGLWELRRSREPGATARIEDALASPDARLRRLALRLLRDLGTAPSRPEALARDADPEVRLEAAFCLQRPEERLAAMRDALRLGAAHLPRLRWAAALETARRGRREDFEALLADGDPDVRLAGLMALDEAFHEKTAAAEALAALRGALERPDKVQVLEILAIAERWRASGAAEGLEGALGRFLEAVAAGAAPLETPGEKRNALEALAAAPASRAAIAVLARLARDPDPGLRSAACDLLASAGPAGGDRAAVVKALAADETAPAAARLDALATLAALEREADPDLWSRLLASPSREAALGALRALRVHADRAGAVRLLEEAGPALAARGEPFASELAFARALLAGAAPAAPDKAALRGRVLEGFRRGDPLLGRLAFRALACGGCHLPRGRAAPLGPALDGIASVQPPEYLVDSVLDPSKTIKTGHECEIVVTRSGEVHQGKVAKDGDALAIITAQGTSARVPLGDVARRERQDSSLMPEGLEQTMTEAEIADLVAYLASLVGPQAAERGPGSREAETQEGGQP
ncbi:MAG: c-type cytochrome [Planctomycetes bacterium]|nr:c-type cytochrome [Planctomycetota bacterium]